MKSLTYIGSKVWDAAVVVAIIAILLSAPGCPPDTAEAGPEIFDDLVLVGFNFGYNCSNLNFTYDECLSMLRETIKE